MMSAALSRRAQELVGGRAAFVTATVVRAQRPTSVVAGSVALVLGDGTIEGFVGGTCAEQSVRAYALKAMTDKEAVLLRILPDAVEGVDDPDGAEVASEAGSVTVRNPCLSGGAIEVFLEPVLPAPRVLVVGDTPIADAVVRLGSELELDVIAAWVPEGDDLALVVAAHGRDELEALRLGLEAGVPYVGLVASPKRGAGVLAELRADGVPEELLDRIDVPAGLDFGARTPPEIALSILASVVSVRREQAGARATAGPQGAGAATPAPALVAIDPVCGMTVAAVATTLSVEHDGRTVYFCCAGCRTAFLAEHEHALVGE